MGSRHFIRSSFARSMYERMLKEEHLRSLDKSQWYKCDLKLVDDDLQELFAQSNNDSDTDEFLERCYEKSDWFFTQIFHALAKALLCWFMTRTSINGFLGRGSMFVFSAVQFQALLGIPTDWKSHTLLDLGAGDGKVTDVMASHFDSIHVTEISPVMRRILFSKGYKVLEVDEWSKGSIQYDVISCLNLLDRCDKPLTLLQQIRNKLKPGSGRLIIALVLPLSQYVEAGKTNHRPSEKLQVTGSTFESQASSLMHGVIADNGFEVVRWTRLPYLCEGDIDQSFYWLDDALIVLKLKDDSNKDKCSVR